MPIEVTGKYIRIRQQDPSQFSRMRTIVLSASQGIHAIVGFKGGKGSVIQAYLFEKNKWTLEKAKNWIASHKGDAFYDFVLFEKLKFLEGDSLLIEKLKSLPIERKNVDMADSLLVDEWTETKDGVIFKDVVFTKEMVQKYPDGMHYKPANELKAALDSLRGKPVVGWAHPKEKVVTSMQQQAGYIVFDSVKWDDKQNRPYGDVFIKKDKKNTELIDAIKKKRLEENSVGFRCDVVKQAGDFRGQHYDYVQKNFFFDHLALVYQGRASNTDGVGINAF